MQRANNFNFCAAAETRSSRLAHAMYCQAALTCFIYMQIPQSHLDGDFQIWLPVYVGYKLTDVTVLN